MTQPSTNIVTVESPLSALRRKWWLALILCPVGAALGAGAAVVTPTKYTAETRLSVGAGELSAQAVPGFALARQQLAEDYARWANNDSAEVGGDDVEITSSPIPNSAIIRVEGKSTNQDAAMKAVKQTATQLTQHINASKPGNDPAQVLKQYQAASTAAGKADAEVDGAQSEYSSAVGAATGGSNAKGDPATLKAELAKAKAQASLLDVKRDALGQKYQQLIANQTTSVNLTTVRNPSVTGNDRGAKLQRYGLLGFVAGGLVSLLLATMLGRRRVVHTTRGPAPTGRGGASRQSGSGARAAATPNGSQRAENSWAQTRSGGQAASEVDDRAPRS